MCCWWAMSARHGRHRCRRIVARWPRSRRVPCGVVLWFRRARETPQSRNGHEHPREPGRILCGCKAEENSPSGLWRTLGKRVGCESPRGFESPILRSETPREIWGSFALSDQGQSWCSEKLPNNVRSASLERPNREVVGAFIAISAPACATQALENDLQAKAGMHKQTRMGLSKLVNVHHRKIEHSVECTHVRRSDWTMSSTALRGPRSGSRRSENRRSQAQALPSRSCLA